MLILSASETLHFPGDDSHSASQTAPGKEYDWTNDLVRPNTGVWFKTLEQHTHAELVSPMLANVVGNAGMLAAWLKGCSLSQFLH